MKILFVEDTEEDKFLINAVLKGEDCEIEFASTFKDALIKKSEFGPDVIVLDVGLPDSSPLNTIRNIRQLKDDCAIAILTGDDNPQNILEATNAGADDYLNKSILRNGPELINRLVKAWYGWKTKNTQTTPISAMAMKKADVSVAEALMMLKFQNDDTREWKGEVKEEFGKISKKLDVSNLKSEERHLTYMGKFGSIEGKQDKTNGSVTTLQAKVKILEDKDKEETQAAINKSIELNAKKELGSKYYQIPKLSKSQWVGLLSLLAFFSFDDLVKIFTFFQDLIQKLMH